MRIKVTRVAVSPTCTIGSLEMPGFTCFTLEDTVREVSFAPVESWKIPGETAIPRGSYQVIINMSQRFKKEMPLLLGVTGFSGVRVHAGNRSKDTEGCILLGMHVGSDHESLTDSKVAVDKFMEIIGPVFASGEEIWIDIK